MTEGELPYRDYPAEQERLERYLTENNPGIRPDAIEHILGYDFDIQRGVSPETAELLARDRDWDMIGLG